MAGQYLTLKLQQDYRGINNTSEPSCWGRP